MGPQRSVAAVVTAGFAVIAAIIVVAWIAGRPRGEQAKGSSSAAAVGMPSHVDETSMAQVWWTRDAVPAGTAVDAALADGSLTSVEVPAELRPEDAVSSPAQLQGRTLPIGFGAGVVITTGNTGSVSTGSAKASVPVDCPQDWAGPVPDGEKLVFVVSAPVAKGTSAAKAFVTGGLRPYLVSAKNAPTIARNALGPFCDTVAAFDLSRGTVMTSSTFTTP